ncbi:MAG: FKBP-type peptidyl-prolyl cis-trans isomerase [Phycisphaeraceae bacterium]
MPPVTILSPHSGRPVVVREQDLGRAIRDDQGKVFYVVEDAEHGRYASMTRKGSARDLERYRKLQNGETPAPARQGPDDATATKANASQAAYDATGVKRRNPAGIALLVLALALVAAGVYVVVAHPEWVGLEKRVPTETQPVPGDEDGAPDVDDGTPSAWHPHEDRLMPVFFAPSNKQTRGPSESIKPEQAKRAESPEAPTPGPASTESTGNTADRLRDVDEADRPRLTAAPAVLPGTPEEFVQRLALADDGAPGEAVDDPTPVIVPTRTWRPEASRPVVLGANDNDEKPYAGFSHTATGLRYKLTHRTDGPPAKAGCVLDVRYTAQTLDGESLIDDGEQTFVLMAGQAIRAFDEGLAGVREGEQLKLFIPRGHSEAGTLPGIERVPDAPFMMDVQLVKVRPGVTHVVERPGDADAEPAMPGDTLEIHYLARVEGRDEVIATTVQNGEPMTVTLGGGAVIPGLELGLAGMRPGETRLISIPPYLAYGEDGAAGGLVPPDAVLSFRVTLVRIVPDQDKAQEQGEPQAQPRE